MIIRYAAHYVQEHERRRATAGLGRPQPRSRGAANTPSNGTIFEQEEVAGDFLVKVRLREANDDDLVHFNRADRVPTAKTTTLSTQTDSRKRTKSKECQTTSAKQKTRDAKCQTIGAKAVARAFAAACSSGDADAVIDMLVAASKTPAEKFDPNTVRIGQTRRGDGSYSPASKDLV